MAKQEVMMKRNGSPALSLHLHVAQSKDNIVSDMGGEKVILSIENGKYYNLGMMGGRIWDLISEPIAVGQVVAALLDEYDVERSACEDQVLAFLARLSEERLIHFNV